MVAHSSIDHTGLTGAGVGFASAIGDKSGHISITDTAFVDLTGMSLTIAGAEGDVLEIICVVSCNNNGTGNANQFVANVGGNDIDPVAQFTAFVANQVSNLALLATHTVLAGDISGGNVTVKIRWLVSAGTGLVANAVGETRVPILTVKNFG